MAYNVKKDEVPISTIPKSDRIERLDNLFQEEFGCKPAFFVRVPGRVNIIGEHIDYCGYPVLPMAVEQDILVAGGLTEELQLSLRNVNSKYCNYDTKLNSFHDIVINTDENGKPFWYNYVLCGVKGGIEFINNKIEKGIRLFIDGNIPPASGLSSSSALVSAACLSFLYTQNAPVNKTDIASLCANSERYIGTQGGGMDQAIAFLAEKFCAQYITFNPLCATPVALPENAAFVVAHSLAEANKAATNDFNKRVMECRLAAKIIATFTGVTETKQIITFSELQISLGKTLDEMIGLVDKYLPKDIYTKTEISEILNTSEEDINDLYLSSNTRHLTDFKLRQRALHVYQEAKRVEDFRETCLQTTINVSACKNGTNRFTAMGGDSASNCVLDILGNLMSGSHDSLKTLYECSHENLDRLVNISKDMNVYARLTGAGWGGCAVALCPKDKIEPVTVNRKSEASKQNTKQVTLTTSQKRRIRRKRLHAAKVSKSPKNKELSSSVSNPIQLVNSPALDTLSNSSIGTPNKENNSIKMSSKEIPTRSREDVKAAREAKKLAKQKAKNKSTIEHKEPVLEPAKTKTQSIETIKNVEEPEPIDSKMNEIIKSKDEVDRANVDIEEIQDSIGKNKDQIQVDRAAKKAAKQAKKKSEDKKVPEQEIPRSKDVMEEHAEGTEIKPTIKEVEVEKDLTVKDVVNTLKDIVNVAKEVQEVTAKVQSIYLEGNKKPEETCKSKADLKAERRAKQEAQRAAKQATMKEKAPIPKVQAISTPDSEKIKEEKTPKQKSTEKTKTKLQTTNRVNWFQHLVSQQDKESLNNIPINTNLHPAIVKLGVQLSSRVVKGSNARCIALLDALKKMLKDYTLPAKTEFARGLEAHLATSLDFLWSKRQPCASQTNAVKFFRHHLTQLPNNVDEFDAKKILQEEIDRYIREQIDMAAEAISIAVRKKISNGDTIFTYGCSCLIERILLEAWASGLRFRTVVGGNRVGGDAPEMVRRLATRRLPCTYVDITALSSVMSQVSKVVLGASALLANGWVVGAAGTALCALVARSFNVPVLVACETHKFTDRVHTDALVYNEIGDPDHLIDKNDENSPLKEWRANPNLTPLNLTYDVTPASLITAVVTELAILPCTSAPVVLRFKLSEYGI
ncbi:hypothetical protein K1T71_002125 [Dendrolimus kikuchii]|uniref:Uncharacterized protein n=1 Tax=Dendrolimus kikuchii TaxID=765133 RepID=A0ACC1DFV3_9NEOP|nr:hypothetical protein K1T71_002125 [Dendrolimus kikuchii]